jgi:hypothetical protein
MVTAAKDRITGPGKIQKLPDGSTLLFNFDIDSSVLKPEHRAFLEQNIVSAANANPGGVRVVIGGSADRLGDSGHNVALSNRRIEAVSAFLKQRKPGYPWVFVGFGQGAGESSAERAGDKDDTRDDLFRSVIIEVLTPGRPIPPKPRIPNAFPKKPNVFPRQLPRPNPSTCLIDSECPLSRDFSIMLIVGGTGGEILEAGFLTFMIQDPLNRLSCLYTLSAIGLATPGLPITPLGAGSPSIFHISKPTKVTRFGPIGGITSATVGPPGSPPVGPQNKTLFSVLSFTFKDPDSSIPAGKVIINNFDTGPISIQGGGIHAGRFKAESVCRGGLGADRT